MGTATIKIKPRVRWEFRVLPMIVLLVVTILAVASLLPTLTNGGESLLAQLARWTKSHLFRQITGFVALGLILLELAYALVKRNKVRLPGDRARWRVVHILVGATLLPLIVVHTGGRWGHNLNGLLLTSLVGTVLVGVGGKLGEALKLRQAERRHDRKEKLDSSRNSRRPFHATWLQAHTVLVGLLLALVAFHVFSVYYF
ncbi:MAG TPA: hypothetical protein VF017_07910 [Thermoanaerobaculia bacterium]|nr:hypothetical protein [Thermoanaerobaculia bacterium]